MKLDQLRQEDFERALIDSAVSDEPVPGASQRAWTRFVAAAAAIAATPPPTAGGPSAVARRRSEVVRVALRWLAIGAVTGSALTLTFVRVRSPRSILRPLAGSARPEPSLVIPPALSPPVDSGSGETGAAASAEASGMTVEEPPAASRAGSSARIDSSLRQTSSSPLPPTESLAAEVAALDSARVALDRGAPDEALAILDRYRRAFPRGKLATEGQVARIEALAAKGDVARASIEASRFLEEHPSAPQRGRVKALQWTLRARMPGAGK